ncbi:MAG: prepilin-type N-terminal cleavage/methylation domain-containing protein [Campylobacterales bacterium]|nr:prepilin-type N-terminal cleavage/methylation domain-containing protein [Campylobacterales bacterium]
MQKRRAFTLIEVLISIALLGFIVAVLYKSLDMVRFSNKHLYNYLQSSSMQIRAINTLYLDILKSDGNLTIKNDNDFSRLCINSTQNSLYNLAFAKVCWVVAKEKNELLRVEGNEYQLPSNYDEPIEVDAIMIDVKQFEVNRNGDKVLVMLAAQKLETVSFLVQGIKPPPLKANKAPNGKKKIDTKTVEKDAKDGLF